MSNLLKNPDTSKEEDGTSEEITSIEKLEKYLNHNYEFRYNMVKEELEFRYKKGSDKFESLTDRHKSELRTDLARRKFKGYKSFLDDLLLATSFSKDFNPFTSYFETLPHWDGEKDYINELCSFVKTTNDEWFYVMFKKHIIRTVACALRKLDFNKYCFTLQGKQDDGKSFFIRFLIPLPIEAYYRENPPLDNKDSLFALGKYLIINLDELHDLDKTNANKVKSLFSQAKVMERKHFAKTDTEQPRYASFFGTVNERDFLNDVTGNVRWLVHEILDIKHDNGGCNGYMALDINKVWSQAYALLINGFDYRLTDEEKAKVSENNRVYQKTTPEIELIQKYFEPTTKENESHIHVTSTDIQRAISIATGNSIHLKPVNIGRALTYLGFKREMHFKNKIYGYYVITDNRAILEVLQN